MLPQLSILGLNVVRAPRVHVLEAWPQHGKTEAVRPLRVGASLGLVEPEMINAPRNLDCCERDRT